MSELKKAKQRMLFKSTNFAQIENEPSDKQFVRSPHTQSITKLNHRNIHEERYSEMEEADTSEYRDNFSRFSPEFSKTDRFGKKKKEDQFDIMSERVNLFKKEPKKQRRVTQFSRRQEEEDQDMYQFSEKDCSIYNQSPAKAIKVTVHPATLSLVISKGCSRKAYSPNKPRECEKSYMDQLIQDQKMKNSAFTDVMFPPKNGIIFNKKYMYLEEGLKFERVSKIYEAYKVRLIKFCEPAFIISGKFTSPAVYSALTILAEEPARVLDLIGSQEFNQNGIYFVHVCKDGIWRYILIDDYLPVKILLKRSLLFAHTISKDNTHEFWPAILEKALAKVYGTYQDLFLTADKGIQPIFRALTGYPVSSYLLNKDFRAFLIIIDAAIKKKQIVVLQSISEEYQQTGHLKKLQTNHSYQILEVKKASITLRNLSEKELITRLSFEEAMIFTRLLIFRNENNYVYISRKLRHKMKYYSTVKVTVPERTKCYWDIWENNEAYYKNHIGSSVAYSKSPYTIVIKLQHSQEMTYDSVNEQIMITESGKEIELKKGTYMVYVHLCQSRQQDFVLSYYGQSEIETERVKNMQPWALDCNC